MTIISLASALLLACGGEDGDLPLASEHQGDSVSEHTSTELDEAPLAKQPEAEQPEVTGESSDFLRPGAADQANPASEDAIIDRLDVGDGEIIFLDEGDGGIAMVLDGSSLQTVRASLEGHRATPLELYQALAPSEPVPSRILANHQALADLGRAAPGPRDLESVLQQPWARAITRIRAPQRSRSRLRSKMPAAGMSSSA
jgi:hypothetical protein